MLNSIIMASGAAIFVCFWAYLAWDAHKEIVEAEKVKTNKQPSPNSNRSRKHL